MDFSLYTIIMDILDPFCLFSICIGVFSGLIIGALPGFTANMGVALLLPVTFNLPPVPALVMLASLYTAAIYGGSFSAILLYTPGTSASAATALDGYPLTCRGESNKALRIASFSSVVGGVMSCIALLVLAPPLSYISILFGPSEYFFLALFGLTIIGTLATDNILKGLLAGVIGLCLSLIGQDLDTGFLRYTFGIPELSGGVAFVPAVIGLFSMAQVFDMCEKTDASIQHTSTAQERKWRIFPLYEEIREIKGTMFRSSIIGIIIGLLPGAGGDIGSWTSYNEAKRFSKHKEEFGNGSIEGISASETANNAVTGSALIPMLTLGIPGSSTAAILLGALIMHGLVPGYELFSTHGRITYTVIAGLLFANIVMGFIGMLIAKYASSLARLPKYTLVTPIAIFAVVGSFAINNSIFDVYVMLIFGFAGYIMRLAGIPAAPIILGLILGPIAEQGLRQTLTLSRGDVFSYCLSKPISLVLIALIALSIGTSMLRKKKAATS
ncbi:MAG: tripartite tricarboxylate transporter permease [Mailhella sp.]|nr:tripartite tricarboxylate transporter permease [Mailhella sp.]